MAMKKTIQNFFTEKPEESYNYGKIINEKQFDRIIKLSINRERLFMAAEPIKKNYLLNQRSLLTSCQMHRYMKDEIFGPVLPVISFNTSAEAKAVIDKHPNPLAFYIFTSSSKKEKEWLDSCAIWRRLRK